MTEKGGAAGGNDGKFQYAEGKVEEKVGLIFAG
jgi:hypothetical protein